MVAHGNIRVVLADDHAMVREALAQILEESGCIRVVGQASDGAQLHDIVARAQPDVLILDYSMPGLDGLLTARLIKEERPDQKIILYTAYLDADLERKAARAGIALCVEKADGILTLERDIRRLAGEGS